MSDREALKEKADRLCELMKKSEELKTETEKLQAEFIKAAEEELSDTKLKTVIFWGTENRKVTVSAAGTVKPVSFVMIKDIFGRLAPDFVKEEMKTNLTAEGKEILRILAEGDRADPSYLKEAVSDLDTATMKAVRKKLKGCYEKDMKTFMNTAGLSREEASDRAYLVREAMNGEKVINILRAAGGKPEEVGAKIRAAVILDETVKVRADYEQERR